jgi:hypothetical protein
MNKAAWVIILVLIAGASALGYFAYNKSGETQGPVACTLEAKLCPDGSSVGRVGPNCEFAACPADANSTSTQGGGGSGIVAFKSGVNGVVMVGPTCPVIQNPPQSGCEDRPLSTLIAIFKKSDPVHAYVLTRSDKEGKFSAALSPGEYIIGAGESQMPTCPQTPIEVQTDKYISVTISCDSGIR